MALIKTVNLSPQYGKIESLHKFVHAMKSLNFEGTDQDFEDAYIKVGGSVSKKKKEDGPK